MGKFKFLIFIIFILFSGGAQAQLSMAGTSCEVFTRLSGERSVGKIVGYVCHGLSDGGSIADASEPLAAEGVSSGAIGSVVAAAGVPMIVSAAGFAAVAKLHTAQAAQNFVNNFGGNVWTSGVSARAPAGFNGWSTTPPPPAPAAPSSPQSLYIPYPYNSQLIEPTTPDYTQYGLRDDEIQQDEEGQLIWDTQIDIL